MPLNPDPFLPLFTHIRKFVALDDGEAAALTRGLRCKKLKKKDFLLKEGQVCTSNYFVLKGCLRMYFIREDGVEHIIQFAIENWWITDFQSLDWQQSSRFHIQAIETTEVAILDRRTAPTLCARLPQFDHYLRLIVQRAFAAAQQNLFFLYTFSGEERYHHFNDAFPEFVQRIPQYMVASYLGFTPEFISKIKTRRK
ncbi:Crp/Fnr family transcriptional regulator [Puia dinghuensis]|uniref:Cyclic nucleotide-binding protein n=1 Tax=Puia dinghuensis TaxID=1792502 RepID=A0A8J2UDX0_9BACT|nr:Crp/Fnr family transcriptional regulator [Puia dinghuensis]GGB02968.1 cyclic nucleotide-binding protein [Puia dinghuensis]